jgi:hypothetical protein
MCVCNFKKFPRGYTPELHFKGRGGREGNEGEEGMDSGGRYGKFFLCIVLEKSAPMEGRGGGGGKGGKGQGRRKGRVEDPTRILADRRPCFGMKTVSFEAVATFKQKSKFEKSKKTFE